MQEGKPIWVESLLSPEEYRECAMKYPYHYGNGKYPPEMFPCEFKWRWDMGKPLTAQKIELVNTRIDNLKKLIKS